MVMCVSGNVTLERAVELAEKWFGDIERGNVTPRNLPQEPRQVEARVQRVHREVPENVLSFGFHMCGINNCLLYTSPSPRDVEESRMPSSA